MDLKWVVRELLTKTVENEQQMMMTKLSEAKGQEFRSVILLMSMGREINVGVADWLAGNGY